ncbi:hypothetical protein BV25DRAFT_1828974 [Artomyces pyxidatus]|uniref:Uncharacterized protein n=1 Tax=Artomyces pyxidatus TaxID=48021 RepID=A0ACB8ST88_9AGAM|nr:hypothetical protein BV25DRAFT_1828974 [Artomyces pyxidatus]
MEAPSKRKVTAKVDFNNIVNRPPPRPVSPFKALHGPSSVLSEPPQRPKAKVNSSATVINRKVSASSSVVSSVARAAPSTIPRPNSPFKRPVSPYKPLHSHTRDVSSTRSAVDGPTSKPRAALSAHALSRQRSMTATPTDPSFSIPGVRVRRGSGTFSQPPNSRSSSPNPSHLSPASASSSPAGGLRVKAKVTGLARSSGLASAPSTPSSVANGSSSPPYATTRPIQHRARAPSIPDFGAISNPPSPTTSYVPLAYPITTPAPAANPHRYASPRTSPSTGRFQSFASHHDTATGPQLNITAKVDPAAVPLPPQSPPASTLSFSSRSSQSSASHTQSSVGSGSTAPTFNSHVNGVASPEHVQDEVVAAPGQMATLDALVDLFDSDSRRESGASVDSLSWERDTQRPDPDRKIRAEAKSNRKVRFPASYPHVGVVC